MPPKTGKDNGKKLLAMKRKSGDTHRPAIKKQKVETRAAQLTNKKSLADRKPDTLAAVKAAAKLAYGKSTKVDKRQQLKEATSKWEKLRRSDTEPQKRAELLSTVLQQVQGRVAQVATSPTGSRVLQACAKHGSPEQRKQLLQQIMPQLLELSKSPYGHFLVCKLIATAPKSDIAGILAALKGNIAMLLRHPCGAAVIDELYNSSSAAQRNHLAAEFYGKEYTLLSQEAAPAHLSELLKKVNPAKRRIILQRMAMQLIPIMEKALVDPVLTHRLIAEYLQAAGPSARSEAMETLAGEPLLRMVHTRDGAWAANAVLCHGTAKDCKKLIKAMKGHVETMAKDRWGSLVLAAALSHVDDTVLMRKVLVTPLQAKLEELLQDKHARVIFLQLLAPDKPRYLQAELQEVVHPCLDPASSASTAKSGPTAAVGSTDAEDNDQAEADAEKPVGQRKKTPIVRRTELLGKGEDSLAAALLTTTAAHATEFLVSETASDSVVELALGATGGILEQHQAGVEALQDTIAREAKKDSESERLADTVYGSRALRRMILASQEGSYSAQTTTRLAKALWPAFQDTKEGEDSHAKKVVEAFKKTGYS